jgi:hypothetical protein
MNESTPSKLDAALETDIQKGMQFLGDNTATIQFRLGGGKWGFAIAETEAAEQLEREVRAERHAGASFEFLMQSLVSRATGQLDYTITTQEVPSKVKGHHDVLVTLLPTRQPS